MYWKTIFVICWPIILFPILMRNDSKEMRCVFILGIMSMYWLTEAIPMTVTSLIPIALFPAFGILSTKDVCSCYLNDAIIIFIGGIILAISVEQSNLHMRFAINVIRCIGCSHRRLVGSLVVITTFLSMWITNTAATALMVPIIFAVLNELEQEGLTKVYSYTGDPEDPESERRPTNVTKAYLLVASYASTFGGTGSLIGTGTNLTFKGIFESTFPLHPGISFTQWLLCALPQMLINAFLTWVYVLVSYLGLGRPKSKDARSAKIGHQGAAIAKRVVNDKYKKLGKMTFQEYATAFVFLVSVALWLFREPRFMRGWAASITDDQDIRDSASMIFIVFLLFIIPKNPTFIYSCSKDANIRPKRRSEGLITWRAIETKMPWSFMFLIGGGFGIARGVKASGLTKWLEDFMKPLNSLSHFTVLCLVCVFTGIFTEFTANIAIGNMILPVIAQMGVAMQVDPIYFMVPTAIMCSYAFRLPQGTPPNAIIKATGNIPTKSLMIGGCIPSIFSLITVIITFPTWGVYVYNINGFPDWAKPTNITCKDLD